MYRKKTLRNMAPVTRRYARNLNSLQGILKRLQNLTQDIARLELDSQALLNRTRWEKAGELHAIHTPIDKATEILFEEEQTHEL